MARYITISTIGARPPRVESSKDAGAAAEIMAQHLVARIEQVLPDQPDLIVLPEMCDLPTNYPATSETVGVTATVPVSAVSDCGTGKTAGKPLVAAVVGPASSIATQAALTTPRFTIRA